MNMLTINQCNNDWWFKCTNWTAYNKFASLYYNLNQNLTVKSAVLYLQAFLMKWVSPVIVGDEGRQRVVQVTILKSKSTLNEIHKDFNAGRYRGVDASQRRHVGDLFPLPGPTSGSGGISCTPQSRTKVAQFSYHVVLGTCSGEWMIECKIFWGLNFTIFAGFPPTLLDSREVPVLLRTSVKGLLMQVSDLLIYGQENCHWLETGGDPQKYCLIGC